METEKEKKDFPEVMTMQVAAEYVEYKNKRSFFRGWVLKHKVPFELRGNQKIFLKSILDKWLVKVAERTARKVYAK